MAIENLLLVYTNYSLLRRFLPPTLMMRCLSHANHGKSILLSRRSYCWRVVVKGSCYYYLFLCLAARVKVERERRRHCGLTRRRRTTCILRQMPLEPIITKFVAAMVWIFLSWWERIQSDQIFKRGIMYLGDNSFSKRLFFKLLRILKRNDDNVCRLLLGKIIAY